MNKFSESTPKFGLAPIVKAEELLLRANPIRAAAAASEGTSLAALTKISFVKQCGIVIHTSPSLADIDCQSCEIFQWFRRCISYVEKPPLDRGVFQCISAAAGLPDWLAQDIRYSIMAILFGLRKWPTTRLSILKRVEASLVPGT